MNSFGLAALGLLGVFLPARGAFATKSAELYTSAAYGYGRYETRMRVAAGDGVVSAFFLWKDGSEKAGTFWNELDYEKIGANCQLSTNALYGNPSANHSTKPTVSADLCGEFHLYGYEWTTDYIAWSLDGKEIRRETGETAAAFAQNASPHGLLPVDERNPILLTNDGVYDNWQGEYAILLASSGGPRLAGIVIGTSPNLPKIEENIAGWRGLVEAAHKAA